MGIYEGHKTGYVIYVFGEIASFRVAGCLLLVTGWA